MQPPRAAGSFRINGKEWKHMAQEFLAQDCSSNLSAPVNLWHFPSCLQSLREVMLSGQPECPWLTFAMEWLALTLTVVLCSSENYWPLHRFLKDKLHRLKNHFVLLVGFKHVHRHSLSQFCRTKRSVHSSLFQSEGNLLWQDSCNHYPPALGTHQLDLDYSLGNLRSKICGDGSSLSLSLKQKWPDLSAAVLLQDVSPREIPRTPHISHSCEVHASQSTY